MHDPPESDLVCSACGAEWPDPMPRCWLCRREAPAIRRPPVRTGAAEPLAKRQPVSFSLATLMSAVAVVAVGGGLATWSMGYAFLYFMFVALPLGAVGIREMRSRAHGREMTWSSRIATFFISIAIIQAVAILLFVAAIAALFIACFTALSRAGGP